MRQKISETVGGVVHDHNRHHRIADPTVLQPTGHLESGNAIFYHRFVQCGGKIGRGPERQPEPPERCVRAVSSVALDLVLPQPVVVPPEIRQHDNAVTTGQQHPQGGVLLGVENGVIKNGAPERCDPPIRKEFFDDAQRIVLGNQMFVHPNQMPHFEMRHPPGAQERSKIFPDIQIFPAVDAAEIIEDGMKIRQRPAAQNPLQQIHLAASRTILLTVFGDRRRQFFFDVYRHFQPPSRSFS